MKHIYKWKISKLLLYKCFYKNASFLKGTDLLAVLVKALSFLLTLNKYLIHVCQIFDYHLL